MIKKTIYWIGLAKTSSRQPQIESRSSQECSPHHEKVCWHPVSRPRASCSVRRLTKTLNMWIFNKAACRPARGGSHQNGDQQTSTQPLPATWTHGDIVPDIYTLLGHRQLTRRRLFIFIQVTTQVKWFIRLFFIRFTAPCICWAGWRCVVCGVDQCLVSNFKADHF